VTVSMNFTIWVMSTFLAIGTAICPVLARADDMAHPSFDCAKASRPIEKLVCGDHDLAAQDSLMAAEFVKLRDRSGEKRATLIEEQRDWLATIETICSVPAKGVVAKEDETPVADCLERLYSSRVDAIKFRNSSLDYVNQHRDTLPIPGPVDQISCVGTKAGQIAACKAVLGGQNVHYVGPAVDGIQFAFGVPDAFDGSTWNQIGDRVLEDGTQYGCCINSGETDLEEGSISWGDTAAFVPIFRLTDTQSGVVVGTGEQIVGTHSMLILPKPGKADEVRQLLRGVLNWTEESEGSGDLGSAVNLLKGNDKEPPWATIIEPSEFKESVGGSNRVDIVSKDDHQYVVILSGTNGRQIAALFELFADGKTEPIGTYQSRGERPIWSKRINRTEHPCPTPTGTYLDLVDEKPVLWIEVASDFTVDAYAITLDGIDPASDSVLMKHTIYGRGFSNDEIYPVSKATLQRALLGKGEDVGSLSGPWSFPWGATDDGDIKRTRDGVYMVRSIDPDPMIASIDDPDPIESPPSNEDRWVGQPRDQALYWIGAEPVKDLNKRPRELVCTFIAELKPPVPAPDP
jgi:uncharacterized protein YecT (DUF1311 family)